MRFLVKEYNSLFEKYDKWILYILLYGVILGNLLSFIKIGTMLSFSVQTLSAVLVLLYCLLEFVFRRSSLKEWSLGTKGFLCFYIFWIIYACIGLVFVADKTAGIKEIFRILLDGSFVFCLIILVNSKERLQTALTVIKICGFILILLFFIQLFFNFELPVSRYTEPDMMEYIKQRGLAPVPTTIFHNENDMCAFLLFIFAIYFSELFKSKSIKDSIGKLICLFLIALIVTIANSTIARISLYIVFICAFLFIVFNRNNDFKGNLIKLSGTFGTMLIAFYGAGLKIGNLIRTAGITLELWIVGLLTDAGVLSKSFQDQFILSVKFYLPSQISSVIQQIEAGESGIGTVSIRKNLIFEGLAMLFNTCLLGVGPGAFKDNVKNLTLTNHIVNPHNLWIEILSQYGIIVFAAFVFLYIRVWLVFLKYERHFKRADSTAALFLFFGALFILAAILPSSALGFYHLWIILGLMIAASNVFASEMKAETHKNPGDNQS